MRDGTPDELPPKVHMPLLDYITSTSLDADYAQAAERPEEQQPKQVRPGLAALVVMGLFGLLVATAAIQTARNAGDESSGRDSLVNQIKARSSQLDARRARISTLRDENDSLQQLYLETTSQGRALSARLDRLGVVTGGIPVSGPGVKVVVDDAPEATSDSQRVLDSDLQKLANALWASGAEAISINGQRLNNISAIRFAGSAVTVNQVALTRPYTVLAVGDPDTMPARFVETEHGRDWLDLHAVPGLQFKMTSEESMRLPAAPARILTVRHAMEGETP
ncbi:MAG TPA: DUF881 domain-containing protein [Nocardioidaceae bacterium]|nr:DUF881 domain-containing protein [Nocardioidaceae bacterium]